VDEVDRGDDAEIFLGAARQEGHQLFRLPERKAITQSTEPAEDQSKMIGQPQVTFVSDMSCEIIQTLSVPFMNYRLGRHANKSMCFLKSRRHEYFTFFCEARI
jgi:hypothetical protein